MLDTLSMESLLAPRERRPSCVVERGLHVAAGVMRRGAMPAEGSGPHGRAAGGHEGRTLHDLNSTESGFRPDALPLANHFGSTT